MQTAWKTGRSLFSRNLVHSLRAAGLFLLALFLLEFQKFSCHFPVNSNRRLFLGEELESRPASKVCGHKLMIIRRGNFELISAPLLRKSRIILFLFRAPVLK